MNITNINISIRFNKTREIFPSVTRVLGILPTTSAISASVERENFKGCAAKYLVTSNRKAKVSSSNPAASYA